MPTSVTVEGTYHNQDGTPASGRVSFRLSTPLTSATSDLLVSPVLKTVDLEADGSFSVDLYATNDPEITQQGATYTVTEVIDGATHNGQRHRSWSFELDYDTPGNTVDLADLAPVEDATVTYGARDLPEFYIAASDAPARIKRVASAICTGEDDQQTINDVLAALGEAGGVVRLSPGTFTLTDSIEITAARAVFEGSGWGTVLECSAAEAELIQVLADDVIVRDLALDGQDTAYRGAVAHEVSRVHFSRLKVLNMERAGLKCTSDSARENPATDIWFTDNYLENCIDAIACDYYNERPVIRGNHIVNCTQAISLDGLNGLGTQSPIIEGNTCVGGNGESVIGLIYINMGSRQIVRGNVIAPASGNGLYIRNQNMGGSDTNGYGVVSDNTIIGVGSNGIYATHPGGVRIHDNLIQGFTNGLNLRGNSGQLGHVYQNRILGATTPIVYENATYWDTRDNEGALDNLRRSTRLALEAVVVTGDLAVADNVLKPGARIPWLTTLAEIRARVGTAPVGAGVVVGINRNGSQITSVTIADGATTGSTTGLSIALSAGDVVSFDIDSVGSGTAGADLAIQLIGV